jgi:TRAP transporter TAXI family solute receptor
VILLEAILPYYGLSVNDIKLVPLTDGERASALTDGQIDIGVWFLGVTSPTLTELTTINDVRFIPSEEALLKKANEAHPFYTIGEIAPNTFKGQLEAVPSIVMWGLINCGEYLGEELVYEFTKNVFEHKSEVEDVVRLFKDVNLESATLGIDIPLHPGAKRYFEEKGIKFDKE